MKIRWFHIKAFFGKFWKKKFSWLQTLNEKFDKRFHEFATVSDHPKEDIQIQATVVKLAMRSDGLEINSLLTDLKEKGSW